MVATNAKPNTQTQNQIHKCKTKYTSVKLNTLKYAKSLGFCGTSLDVENFLKGECVLVSSGNIIHMSKF